MSLGGDKRLGPQLQRRILAFLAGEASQEAVSGSLEKRLEAKGATTAGKLVVHACLGFFMMMMTTMMMMMMMILTDLSPHVHVFFIEDGGDGGEIRRDEWKDEYD